MVNKITSPITPLEEVEKINELIDTKANDADVVHKANSETITGQKTFSNKILRSSTIDQSSTSGEVEVGSISVYDKDGSEVGAYNTTRSNTSNTNRQRVVNKNVASSGTWYDLRCTVSDDGHGFVNTAKGSNIIDDSTTAVTNSTGSTVIPTMGWVNNPATSTNVVHRSGDETIGGEKTFTGYIKGQAGNSTNHAIKLGYNGVDYMNFYEYGGLWNFYKSRSGTNTLVGKIAELTTSTNDETLATTNWVTTKLSAKQDTLVSGTNIKTINGSSVLGSGDLTVSGTVDYKSLIDTIYPVGSIYIGVTSECPLAAIKGTWVLKSSGRVLQGADSNHLAGSTIEAGLPNITGKIESSNGTLRFDSQATQTGSLSMTFKTNAATGGNYNGINSISFDASRSSSIYGKSTTVQPPAYVVNIWQRTA